MHSRRHFLETVCKESNAKENHIQFQFIQPWFRVTNFKLMFDLDLLRFHSVIQSQIYFPNNNTELN